MLCAWTAVRAWRQRRRSAVSVAQARIDHTGVRTGCIASLRARGWRPTTHVHRRRSKMAERETVLAPRAVPRNSLLVWCQIGFGIASHHAHETLHTVPGGVSGTPKRRVSKRARRLQKDLAQQQHRRRCISVVTNLRAGTCLPQRDRHYKRKKAWLRLMRTPPTPRPAHSAGILDPRVSSGSGDGMRCST